MEIKTYGDLQDHLLATMDSFSDQMCKANSGISKETFWNMCMGSCMQKDPSSRVNEITVTNVLREFPEYTRSDYKVSPFTDEDMTGDLW